MKKYKNALISVFDKNKLDQIAHYLIKKKYTIYSTGGSSQYLKKFMYHILKYQNILSKRNIRRKSKNSSSKNLWRNSSY